MCVLEVGDICFGVVKIWGLGCIKLDDLKLKFFVLDKLEGIFFVLLD